MTFRLPATLTIDSSVLVKALVPPLRRKEDEIYKQQMQLHTKALRIFEDVVRKNIAMCIPSVVLIEVGAVVSRMTNDEWLAKEAVEKVRTHAIQILFDYDLLEPTILTAIQTKASGFDNLILSCAISTGCAIISDDSRLHEIAMKYGHESYLLRELV
ncbi:MAG: PIN domain-containing protein [Candidatus Methanoperedens sp.]|nr:PIN domain-containing protein [Candidatus Methanoperedens sp.]